MQSKPWTPNIGGDALPAPTADLKRFYEQVVTEFLTGNRQLTKANWDAWVAEFEKLGGVDWENKALEEAKANNYLK